MAAIHARITREHNRRHRVFGSGWQSRYRARLIQNDQDLRHLVAYVHLNPVVAGLVDDPAEYELSGHRALIGRPGSLLVDADAALRCFGEDTTSTARLTYLDYLRGVAEAKWARGSLRKLPWWEQVHDDHQTVEAEKAPPEARTFDDKHPELPPPLRQDLGNLLTRACRLFGKLPSELTGTSRSRSISVARRRFAFIAISHFGHCGNAVARELAKSPCQVSRWLAAQTEAVTLDHAETTFIEDTVCKLLLEKNSNVAD